jgi:lysophospholipase L1-like esterase
VGTWAAAPQLTEERNLPPAPGLAGNTLRQIVHVSLGGDRLRVRLSNEFGNGPVTIAAATVARAAASGSGTIVPGSDKALTFAGRSAATIPAGGVATSDPLAFDVTPLSDLAVTIAVTDAPTNLTGHPGSRTTSYLQPAGDVRAASLPNAKRVEHWYLLTGIEVAHAGGSAVVVLGNSIADGRGSGTDRQNRWPDNLARRLQARRGTSNVAVLNAGIGGNCVLRECIGPSGWDRLARDVLQQTRARWLIVSEGVNDIGGTRTADSAQAVAGQLIDAYAAIIARARQRGLRVYGATILPFSGSFYDSPEREAARQRVNVWVRTSGAFDAVIDFDAAMRDSVQPARLRSDVDDGDHLHPNELGYRVMADAIDLALFVQ